MLSDHVCARSTGRRAPCAAALALRRRPAVPLALASLMVATLLCDLSPEAAGFVVCSSRSSTRSAAFSTSPLCGAASPVRHARRSRGHVTMELRCGASGDAPTEVGSHTRRRMLRWTAASGISCGLCELMFPPATAKAAVAADDDEEEEGADPAAAERASDSRQVALPKLASRFAKGQVKSLGPAGPLGPPDAAAPAWLEGTWQVEYTFERASFPLTKDFAQFKQLLAGSVRTPGDAPGVTTETTQVWRQRNSQTPGAVDLFEEDKASNLMAYYNAFSKDLTIETPKGPRTRKVAWMPILTQRGIYEKINEVQALGSNSYRMIAKEIAPDLSVVGTAPVEIAVVNRKSETSADGQAFVLSELNRIKRLSQGKVKMIETGTGDTEVVTAFIKKGENEITGRHRVLVYLVPFSGPAGDKYGDAAGGAVAIYDYSLSMTRIQE